MNCCLVKEQRPRALLHAQVFSILNSLAPSMTGPCVGMGWVGFIEMGPNKTDEYCETLGSILSSKDVRKVSPVRWACVGFVLPNKAYLQPEAVKKDVILLDEHELAVFHSICYAHSLISSTFAPRLVAPVTTKDSLFGDTDTATSLLLISIWMYRPLIMLLLCPNNSGSLYK